MDLLIFDLDGTLINSEQDLANSVNATRVYMGHEPIDAETVATWVGNGAPVLMRRAMGPDASDEDIERALAYFLDYYRQHMLDHTELYPGVRHGLDVLREAGVKLAVLTNKPVRFSQGILEGLGVGKHFFRVYGGNSFEQKKPHPIGVERLMAEAGTDRGSTMMVGDSYVDVRTARNAGVTAAGVTWGLQPESLKEDPPDLLVDRMDELETYVLRKRRGELQE
jgi:phosphoglycolate phosphatase